LKLRFNEQIIAVIAVIFLGVLFLWACGGDGGGGQGTSSSSFIPFRVYLSNSPGSNSTDTARIVVIDPATNAQIDSLSTNGGVPGELAPHPDGSTLYATVDNNLSVIRVFGARQPTSLAGAGDLFNHVAVSPDGKKLYLLYRNSSGTATLDIKVFDLSVDPASPQLTTTISNQILDGCFGPLGLGVHPDGSKLYLACRPIDSNLPDQFYMVNTATNTPTLTSTFTRDASNNLSINAIAVKTDGSQVYLARADNIAPTVEIFDGSTGTHVGAIALPANALPRAGVLSPDSTTLYVVDQGLGTHVIDATSNSYLMTLPQSKSRGFDISMSPDGTYLYTTLLGSVFVLDATTDTWVTTITGDFTAANQITTIKLPALGPDLVMTAVTGPTTAAPNSPISINNTVGNQGTGSTEVGFSVGLYLSTDPIITTSDTFLGSRSVGTLGPGATDQANTQVTIPANVSSGTYYIGAIADYTNTVSETDESNNALAGNGITISP